MTTEKLMRTDIVDAIQKIQKHMVDMGWRLSPEKYEKWTEIAQYYQRFLNRWPEEELARWYPVLPQSLQRDLSKLTEEKDTL